MTKKPIATAADLEDVPRPRVTATIFRDPNLFGRVAELEAELREAQRLDERRAGMIDHVPRAPQIAEQILELEAQAEASALKITFEELGRQRWTDLVDEHPPTEEQQKDLTPGRRLRWNPDTFEPAVMALSCVKIEGLPDGPHDGADASFFAHIRNDWGPDAFEELWSACSAANSGVSVLPKSSIASNVLQSSAPSAKRRSGSASRAASS